MDAPLPRLLLLDTFGMIFRAYYGRARSAVAGLQTSDGVPTEAVYVFNNMLKRLLDDHQPHYVAAVWEGRGPTYRDTEFPEYKANRDAMPDDLARQLPYIRRLLEAWNVRLLSEDGFEADDTIGRLAREAASDELEVWIVSSDKDLMQAVGKGVAMLDPMKGTLYDAAAVKSRLGVGPEHVADYLALTGDKADNIPGAPGIGPKGAQQLIGAWGDVEKIIEHASEVRRKSYRNSLIEHAEQIRLSKRLTTLNTSGSLRADLETLSWSEADLDGLLGLYRELEFNTLASRMASGRAQEKAERSARRFASVEQFEDWIGAVTGPIAVAVLSAEDAKAGPEAEGIGFAASPDECWQLPLDLLPGCRKRIETLAADIWVHDWKSAAGTLANLGIACPEAADDTMLMAFLLDSSRTKYTLGKTVERRTGNPWTPNVAVAAAHTREFRQDLCSDLRSADLTEVYETIELPLAPVLARMESTGILLNKGILADLSATLRKDIGQLADEIHSLAGRGFNIGSPMQLAKVLYEELGLPKPKKRGKSRTPSTASDILEGLKKRHPIALKVLEWRQYSKLRNTYVDVLPKLVGPDGRLHTTFNPTGSATGRLSSQDPNLQNIPVRTSFGRQIRRAFEAAPECCLISADYSQIELRILAHMSGDPSLVDAFSRGADIHTLTASEVLGVRPELVTPDDRSRAKAVNFGIIYGLSPFGLAKQLGITQRGARDYIDRYFERYGTIRTFISETIEKTKERGFSRTLFGRRRPVRGLDGRNAVARRFAERVAVNSPIQGTAADLIKKAMVATDESLRKRGLAARVLLQIHDELLLEAPLGEAAEAASMVREKMEAVAQLDVPLVADLKTGPNWLDMDRPA